MWELFNYWGAGTPVEGRAGFYILLTYPIGSMPVFRVLYQVKEESRAVIVLHRMVSATNRQFG